MNAKNYCLYQNFLPGHSQVNEIVFKTTSDKTFPMNFQPIIQGHGLPFLDDGHPWQVVAVHTRNRLFASLCLSK